MAEAGIVYVNYEDLQKRFAQYFEEKLITEIVYEELDTGWILRFYPEASKFLIIATVRRSDLLQSVPQDP